MRIGTFSIDGLRAGYQKMRGRDCFEAVMKALKYMIDSHPEMYVNVITVVSKYNKDEIPELSNRFESMGVRFARLALVVPIGRAVSSSHYQLSDKELADLFLWIVQKRKEYEQGKFKMPIELSDDGWCGRCLEGKIRGWKF